MNQATSLLQTRRKRILLSTSSPVFLPLLCIGFTLFCLLCLWLCRRRRGGAGGKHRWKASNQDRSGGTLRQCEEGRGGSGGEEDAAAVEAGEFGFFLLQRYLEDQLNLVASFYVCGDYVGDEGAPDCDRSGSCDYSGSGSPLLIGDTESMLDLSISMWDTTSHLTY
ncbi:hypothetical protein Dimus_006733 [Dionaea muscipula]